MTATAPAQVKNRPTVPLLHLEAEEQFWPSGEVRKFVERTLLSEDSLLFNIDHAHLIGAEIGYLWTNVPNMRQTKPIAATAEMPKPPQAGNAWAKAKWRCQMREWFGTDELDFLITIDAGYAASCSDLHFVALLDHELYHCAQKTDEFGAPKFTKAGSPVYGMMGHDVSEFVGIIRRYGAQVAVQGEDFVNAALSKPEISVALIEAVCGSCN